MRPLDPELALRRLGQRFAELRVQRGLTQEELAEQADVSARYIQRIESGNENVSVKTAVRFSNLLRVSLLDLFQKPTGRPTRVRARSSRHRR
jgi:transcriptional regulator with XRE-family HTH domain